MKRLGIALLMFLAALVIAAQLIVERLPLARVRPILERDLGEVLGLEVRIEGPMHASLIPWLRLEVEDVIVDNLQGRPSPTLLEIRNLALELRLYPLLWQEFVFESLELEGVELRIEPDADGAWTLEADLDELDEAADKLNGDSVRLAMRSLEVRDLEVYLDPPGWSPIRSLQVDEIVLSAAHRDSPILLETRGAFEGGRFDVVGLLGTPAELAEPTRPFPVKLEASVIEGRIEVEGTFEDPKSLHGADLRFGAILADPAARARELGFEVPPLGSVGLNGRLVERQGKLAVDDLSVRSRGDGPIEVEIVGSIDDLDHIVGVDIKLDLGASDANLFEKWTTLSLPNIPLRANLHLEDKDGPLEIQGQVLLAQTGAFELRAAGGVGDLFHFRELDIRIDLESGDVRTLADALGRHHALELPTLGPVQGSARLVVHDEILGLEAIDVQLGDREKVWVEVGGSIADLFEISGVELKTRLSSPSAQRLAELFDRQIRELGGLEATFSLSDKDGSLGIENASVKVGQTGDLYLSLVGSFDDLRNLGEIDLETRLQIPDLRTLSRLTLTELVSMNNIDYSAQVQGSVQELRSKGRLQIGNTLFEGTFNRSAPSGKRPKIDFRVHSPLVQLADLLTPTASGEADKKHETRRGFDLAAWWRGDGELPLDQLRAFDAELRLKADRVIGNELLDLENVELSARLENGRLLVDDWVTEYESGRVSGRLELDASGAAPKLDLELEAFNVDLTTLTSQFRKDTDYAGLLDLSLDLETGGTTAQEILSNLNGVFGVMLRDGALVGEYSRALTFNMLRVAIPEFRFGEDAKAEVQCLLALMPIETGMAEMQTFYLEGRDVTIQGTGQVDFVRNAYDLQLTPQLHKPGLVGVAATVEVLGPLEAPEFRTRRGSLVTSAVESLLKNSLRPLTAVMEITAIDRLILGRAEDGQDAGPCDHVLRQRVEQMITSHVEVIDLEQIANEQVVPGAHDPGSR